MTAVRMETLADGVTLYLGECERILPTLAKADAVVTDPAYGVNAARERKSQQWGWRDYGEDGWDKERTPPDVVALAVAAGKHAIVWGGNYFTDAYPPSSKWLIWDKGQSDFSLADVEMAWCSFEGAARRLMYPRSLAMQDGKVHPTQKPIAVMKWCIGLIPPPCDSYSRSISRKWDDGHRGRTARAQIHRHRTRRIVFRHRMPPYLGSLKTAGHVHREAKAAVPGDIRGNLERALLQGRGRMMRLLYIHDQTGRE